MNASAARRRGVTLEARRNLLKKLELKDLSPEAQRLMEEFGYPAIDEYIRSYEAALK